MSSYNILSVHQSEDVQFDDLAALNADLADWKKSGVAELLDSAITSHPDWVGYIRLEDDVVEIAETVEHSFGGYGENCVVYGCWSKQDAKTISKHMTAGKLVFKLDIEGGWPSQFFVITPGKVKVIEETEIKF